METIRCVCERPQCWAHEKYGDKWDNYISQFAEEERNAVAGYIYERSFYESDQDSLFVSPYDFRSLFQGEWPSFKEFTYAELGEHGVTLSAIEWLGSYLKLDQYISNLSYEYFTACTDHGTVWVYAVEW